MVVTNPEYTEGYCQFRGGGDIVNSSTVPLLVYNKSVEEPSLSPSTNNEAISILTIEGKSWIVMMKIYYASFLQILSCYA